MNYLSFAAIGAIALFASAGSTLAAQTISVSLGDDGATATMATADGMAMPMGSEKSNMHITVSPAAVNHGVVMFKVTNASKDFVHEMLVVKMGANPKLLPYDATANKVNEETLGSIGEVSELDPGKSGQLTLVLPAGTYALLCNQAGHYMAGMWTVITVN
jgi:uncharacterized cupredoxin-like copper-binding protein